MVTGAGSAHVRGPVLVTGAAGFAGSHLVDLLVQSGVETIGCRRPGSAHVPKLNASARWVEVDLLDPGGVRAAIAALKPRALYHCAGAPHVASSWQATTPTLQSNVMTTHHVLAAVRDEAPECRVLVVGSAAVYEAAERPLSEDAPLKPSSPYGLSKLAQERLAGRAFADDRVEVVMTRSFNHTGPRQSPGFVTSAIARQLAMIEAGRMPPLMRVGNLETRRDMTDVRDTVRAYQALMANGTPGTIYNVCSGRAVPVRHLVRDLVAQARARVEIQTDEALLRPNDTPLVLGDGRRLEAATGWTPAIPLQRTLHDLLEYWRESIANG